MAFDLSTITNDTIVRPPRIILLGDEKTGKSSFAAGAEGACFLPIKGEEGLDGIKAFKVPVCNSTGDVFGWLGSLYEGEHNHQTVIIDSGSALELLIHKEICTEADVPSINEGSLSFGVGTDRALVVWQNLTRWLDALRSHRNMASIIIGHVKIKRYDDPKGESYDQYQWDVHQKAASLLNRWADSILFCSTKVVVTHEKLGFSKDNVKKRGIEIQPGSRFLYTQKRPAHPGGGRGVYGQLPYELSLGDGTPGDGWKHFRDAVAAAMQITISRDDNVMFTLPSSEMQL
jgi:hypothetical protein